MVLIDTHALQIVITLIPYRLATEAEVHISIYDNKGVLVRQLDMGRQSAASHRQGTCGILGRSQRQR